MSKREVKELVAHPEDKALEVEHNRPGYLGMANRGPDTNGCQFYVTTVGAKWLDGKHTVFGKVLEGMETIYAIEDVSIFKSVTKL